MTDLDRQLQETLKRIVDENGTGVLLENDGRRAVAFAADYLPRAKKERKLLKIVLDTGIAGKIHDDVVVRKQDLLLCRKKYVLRIREDLSIEQGAAEFIVDCIFYAFGLDSGESLSDQSRRAADYQEGGDSRTDEGDQRAGDRWADEDYRAAGDSWEDEDYQTAGDDYWADEDYRRAANSRKDGEDQEAGDRRKDEDDQKAGDRPDSRRENRPDKEIPPKKGKGNVVRLILAGVLLVLGGLIRIFHYDVTRFFLFNLEFGRFMGGAELERYLIATATVMIAAGVILAAVSVAGLLRKRGKNQ